MSDRDPNVTVPVETEPAPALRKWETPRVTVSHAEHTSKTRNPGETGAYGPS